MAEITPPLYMSVANVYDGAALALPWRDVFGGGVVGSGDLAVSAGTGLQVSVAAGACWIPGTDDPLVQGCYRCTNAAAVNLTIAGADATNPRIDTVIAHVYDSEFAGSFQKWALEVLTGTPTAGATLTNLSGKTALPATGYSLVLAYVLVPANAASIVSGDIGDQRPRSAVGSGGAVLGGSFSAVASGSQGFSSATWSKIMVVSEEWDELGWYDAPNSRFTPKRAGRYRLVGYVGPNGGGSYADGLKIGVGIYKNGVPYREVIATTLGASQNDWIFGGSALVDANGSTDYFELWGYQSGGASTLAAGSILFQGGPT